MPRKLKESSQHLRFPSPGPMPRWNDAPRDAIERARRDEELNDWVWRNLVHIAVHTNDPKARNFLATQVGEFARVGTPLEQPAREWLSWALDRLIQKNALPRARKGNAIKRSVRFERIRRLLPAMQGVPRGEITAALTRASKDLCVSYETVRELYYSEDYQLIASLAASKQLRADK
jgi:hypothetical protein